MRGAPDWLLLLLTLLTSGCASLEPVVTASKADTVTLEQVQQLDLRPGTTRAEVTGRLGTPLAIYDVDHVISYRLFEQDGTIFVKRPERASRALQLMLLFSADGRLERVSIVDRVY